MDGLAQARLRGVVAPLNFMMPMAEKPYSYNYEPGPGVKLRNIENEEHQVTIHDARAAAPSLDHDATPPNPARVARSSCRRAASTTTTPPGRRRSACAT